MCGGGPDRAEEIRELGWNPRERPSPEPEAARGARGATGQAIAEETTDDAYRDIRVSTLSCTTTDDSQIQRV